MSCKLHQYFLQRIQSPPGPRLSKRIRNTHPRNYHDLKGKDIDLHTSDTKFARPINLNVFCKLHSYSLQRTRSPPGPCLPKTIRNTYPHDYYDLKGKDIDLVSLVWLSCRVSALQSVVTGLISRGGDHGIHCWWNLIWSKQLCSISLCRA